MIVDCHTHLWQSDVQEVSAADRARLAAVLAPIAHPKEPVPDATAVNHLASSDPVDKAIVLGFKSKYLRTEISNELLAGYIRQHPDKMIGFAGVDPTNPGEAIEEMRHAQTELGFKGITLSPAGQDFHPADSRAMQVFAEAARMRMPVLLHQGVHFAVASKLEYARPALLDEVAREFPALKLVISQMGYPWIDECVVLLGKHPNVYADVSGLLNRPWGAFNALLAAYQYGVIDKLLFGSDFPFASATAAIEALYSINQFALGSSLPTVPRQYLRGIVERDALGLLGITAPGASRPTSRRLLSDEDV